ncbi:MAG: DUF7009 family protein, partial [Terracidiphilus sp.]
VLESRSGAEAVAVRFRPPEVAVILSASAVESWRSSDETGIYAAVDLGPKGKLKISIEKDFACLHRADSGSSDAFPNPHAAAAR